MGSHYTPFHYFLLLALDLVERATDVVAAEWETDGVTIKVVVFSLDLLVNWSKPKVKQGPKLVLSASSNALSACACDRLGSRAWTQDYHTTEVATGGRGSLMTPNALTIASFMVPRSSSCTENTTS